MSDLAAWPFKAGLTPSGPTPSSAGARRDEETFISGKVPKINPVVGQFRLKPRPQGEGLQPGSSKMLPPPLLVHEKKNKIKKITVNLQLCWKLEREPQFHASGRRRRHQWVFGSERTSSTRTDDGARESEVGAEESVQSREKCVISQGKFGVLSSGFHLSMCLKEKKGFIRRDLNSAHRHVGT